jgi:hypothetical protein
MTLVRGPAQMARNIALMTAGSWKNHLIASERIHGSGKASKAEEPKEDKYRVSWPREISTQALVLYFPPVQASQSSIIATMKLFFAAVLPFILANVGALPVPGGDALAEVRRFRYLSYRQLTLPRMHLPVARLLATYVVRAVIFLKIGNASLASLLKLKSLSAD